MKMIVDVFSLDVSTEFYKLRFILTVHSRRRSNFCSNYVSPSVAPLQLRARKAPWIHIRQMYDPSLAAAEIRAEPWEALTAARLNV